MEKDLEQLFYETVRKLEQFIDGEHQQKLPLTVVRQKRILTPNGNRLFDLEIQINNRPFGIVEFLNENKWKTSNSKEYTKTAHTAIFSKYLLPHRYIIKVSPRMEILLFDKYGLEYPYKCFSIDELLKTINSYFLEIRSNKVEKIKNTITKKLHICEVDLKSFNSELTNVVKKYLVYLTYNINNNTYELRDQNGKLKDKPENKFFMDLINFRSEVSPKFYRYTSFNSIFSSINTKSFLFNGIMAMNDISEVNYAEKKLFGAAELNSNSDLNLVHKINQKFISCCSEVYDDLTMYRLYGDNGKGVCLTFEFNKFHHSNNDNIYVGRVSYAASESEHAELSAVECFVKGTHDNGELLDLTEFQIWKHFFKPHHYAIEKEVRILFFNDTIRKSPEIKYKKEVNWKISDYGSINPYVTFEWKDDELPLTLKGILLGPIVPEKITNHLQLRAILRKRHFKNDTMEHVIIEGSSITNYRAV